MENPQVSVQLSGIELIEKSLLRRTESVQLITNFNFDVKVESKINSSQKVILIFVDIDVREQGRDPLLAHIGLVCAFVVDNFEDVITRQGEMQYIIPPDLDVLTKTMSLSTARGVLYSELRGTYLTNAVLPIIVVNAASERPAAQEATAVL